MKTRDDPTTDTLTIRFADSQIESPQEVAPTMPTTRDLPQPFSR